MPDDAGEITKKAPNVTGKDLVPIFVNESLVTIMADMVRLTFSESVYGVPDQYPRVAVVMHPKRALDFAFTLLSTYRNVYGSDSILSDHLSAFKSDAE